jgi:catechol-2,3-dioxygenase
VRDFAVRLFELRLETHNPPALRDFYTGTLGLPLVALTGDALRVQAGNTQLTFERGVDCRYHFAFNIPRNRYEQARQWLEGRVTLIRSSAGADRFPFPAWNADALYFRDPAGNILEFIARHNLPNSTDQPFGSHSLLEVSEIGLVADDVRAAVAVLTGRLGIPLFDGADSDTFTAVGNDHGLFIVVNTGREWFPETGTVAAVHPFTAVIDADAELDYTLPALPYRIRGAGIAGKRIVV